MSRTASAETARVVERHAVRDAPAAVVAGDRERAVPELAHRRDEVRGERALGVRGVVVADRRAERVAVARQVGGDDREAVGKRRRD
jgi:hypothetical protein